MNYSSIIEQAAEAQIKEAFAILVRSIAGGDVGGAERFAVALADIEQARLAALKLTQQGKVA